MTDSDHERDDWEGTDRDESGGGHATENADRGDRSKQAPALAQLDEREGWRVEGRAARVHYRGATDRYSIEFYAPSACVVYWKVPPEGSSHETAVPVGRDTVPTPLRERVREDLAAAGLDPDIERQVL